MFTMCILFFTLTAKAKGVCKGASKQSPDLEDYTAPRPRSPVHKFLDPPLSIVTHPTPPVQFKIFNLKIS